MLTLVAAVLAYDIALDTCDLLSSIVEIEEVTRAARLSSLESRKDRSWTRLEKDMIEYCKGYNTEGTDAQVGFAMSGEEKGRLEVRKWRAAR